MNSPYIYYALNADCQINLLKGRSIINMRERRKIAIDIRGAQDGFKDHWHRGIGRFVTALGSRLPDMMPEYDMYYFFDARYPLPKFQLPSRVELIPCGNAIASTNKLEIIRTQLFIRKTLNKLKPDLTLFFFHEDGILFWPGSVMFVYDLIPDLFPQLYGTKNNIIRVIKHFLTTKIGRQADLILTISENTKRDIINIWGMNEDKISVVYAGADTDHFSPRGPDEIEQVRQRYKLPDKYLFYIGGIDARKNVEGLIRAFSIVCREFNEIGLVIGGNLESQKEFPALRRLIETMGLSEKIILAGFISDEDLPTVYSGSDAFVFPTLYEGFGLPALESMACGTPVITSRTSSIPEVLGELAFYFDASDPINMAGQMKEAIINKNRRDELSTMGPVRAKAFGWEKVASLTAKALVKMLSAQR